MNTVKKYSPSFVALALLYLVVYLLYPFYCHSFEADPIAYLTIAKRYATGDTARAINGYWSPLSCRMVAGMIKAGYEAIPSAIFINTIAATGFAFMTQSFLLKFGLQRAMQWLLNGSLIIFLSYAVYFQWFADLWMCFFLLVSLRLMVSEDFTRRPLYWLCCGAAGGLAYLSKTYALPFLVLQAAIFAALMPRLSGCKRVAALKSLVFTTLITCAIAFAWIWQLHEKYHIWTIGTSGSMNTSWAVNGKQHWKDEYKYLVPPAYSNSPYLWEDPYIVGKVVSYNGSYSKLIATETIRITINIAKMVSNMGAISFFFVLSLLFALTLLLSKRIRSHFPLQLYLPGTTMLIFPIAYALVYTEERYLWYLLPLSMVLMGALIEKVLPVIKSRALRVSLMIAFALSYICNPIMMMKQMYRVGEDDYVTAQQLKALGVQGTFTSNAAPGAEKLVMTRAAYHTGNLYYYHPINSPSHGQLMAEMKRAGVKYYFHFAKTADSAGYVMKDGEGMPMPEITGLANQQFKVYIVNQ